MLVTDGSTVGPEDGGDFDNERDGEYEGDGNKRDGEYEDGDEEEDGIGENNDTSFSFSANKQEQLTVAAGDGGQLDVTAAAASEKRRVGEAASSKEVREGGQKKLCLYAAL